VVREDILATNLNDQQVAFYTSAKVVGDNVKSKLAELMERKRSIANIQSQLDQVNQELATITQEQARIRENMKTLDRQNELYLRYVKIFGAQEDRVANLREQAARLTSEIKQLQKSFDDFLKGLDVA
jgi:predicted nuclease with TOPRIM domain